MRLRVFGLTAIGLAVSACGAEPAEFGASAPGALTAACVDDASQIPTGALRCGGSATVECGTPAATFYVTAAELGQMSCGMTQVQTNAGALGLGAQPVVASAVSASGVSAVCTATVTVEDTTPPQVTAIDQEIWPPNHAWVEVGPADCASWVDTCGASTFRFTHAEVDEPANDRGDGNTEPDIELSCDRARVRRERAGPEDGRIYRLHFEVEDDAGLVSTGSCDVNVPHDQSGTPARWSGASYQVAASGGSCGPATPGQCTAPVPYDSGLNTGPLPSECTKLEGGDIGVDGVSVGFGTTDTATLTSWVSKRGQQGELVGFDITVTSTPAWVSVKAGGEVHAEAITGGTSLTWQHPAGRAGPRAKAISNIVICALPCHPTPPGGGGGGADAGVAPDAGQAADTGSPDGGAPDMGGAPDTGGAPDAGAPDMGGVPDAGGSAGGMDAGVPDNGSGGF